MIDSKKKILLAGAALVLLAGLALIFHSLFQRNQVARHTNLLKNIPATFSGWTVTEQEVANTPELKQAVADMLNYDQAIFRTFKRGDTELSIYAAYWQARKFPARFVAQHTPEVCWPGNGWKFIQGEYNQTFILPNGTPALPVQHAKFEANQQITHVWYWHVVNGQLSGFASGPRSESIYILDAFWRDLELANGEQVFLRISSNKEYAQIKDEELVKTILVAMTPVLTPNNDHK